MVRIGGAAARSALAIASVAATLSFAPRPAVAAAACYAPDRSLVRIPDDAEAGCGQNEVAAELEAAGIRWRGVWNARRTYAANDAVHFKGAAFIALRESKGVRPTDESPWDLLAAKGAEGDRGPAGAKGDRGVTGEVGPRGGTGAKGETGPAGPQGVAGREGASGPQGPAGVQGPAGPGGVTGGTSVVTSDTVGSFGASVSQIFLATPKFTPSRDMSCLVIATVQLSDPSPPAVGNAATFVKVAFDNGFGSRDDQRDDQAYVSTGVAGRQPSVTRSSVFAVKSGAEVRFGVSLKNPGAWSGATAFVQASHFCS